MLTDSNEHWFDRRRAHEDEYFRKRDQELIEQGQLRAQDEDMLRRLAVRAGTFDKDLLRHLRTLGYTAETVTLLHLMPLVEVAWADGHVSQPERALIVAVARARGVEPGSMAAAQMEDWLVKRPSEAVCHGTCRVLGALMKMSPAEASRAGELDLFSSCVNVASASGGLFGFHAISDKEQQVLDRISFELGHADAIQFKSDVSGPR